MKQIDKSGLDVTFHSIATGKLRRSQQKYLDVFSWLGDSTVNYNYYQIRPQALLQKSGFVSVQ